MKPSFFLDRDGVINLDKGYVYKIEDFEWVEDADKAIKLMNDLGYYVFVVTNQSGISRGFYDEEDVENLHSYINDELMKTNAKINDFFISPYHPESSTQKYDNLKHLRKPETGMLSQACEKWSVDIKNSFLIGDKKTDILCGKNYGVNSFLFKGGNLYEFVRQILKK